MYRSSFQTWTWDDDHYKLVQYIIDDEKTLQISKFECEYRHSWLIGEQPNFCEECGADMRGIEDDNYTKDRKLYINSGNLYVLKAFDIYSPFSEENYFTFNDYLFQITE